MRRGGDWPFHRTLEGQLQEPCLGLSHRSGAEQARPGQGSEGLEDTALTPRASSVTGFSPRLAEGDLAQVRFLQDARQPTEAGPTFSCWLD